MLERFVELRLQVPAGIVAAMKYNKDTLSGLDLRLPIGVSAAMRYNKVSVLVAYHSVANMVLERILARKERKEKGQKWITLFMVRH